MIENRPNLLSLQRGALKTAGLLCVDSDPHGANVYVDGQIVIDPITEESKKTPFCTEVIEGRRDIVIRLHGFDDLVRYGDIWPNRTTSIYGRLQPSTGKEITPLYQPIQSLQSSDSSILLALIISMAGSLAAIIVAKEWLWKK